MTSYSDLATDRASDWLPTDCRWVTTAQIARLTGYSVRHTRDRLVRRADFPRPIATGRPRWLLSDVLAWMRNQQRPA